MPKKNKSAPSAKEVGALVQAALSGESGNVLAMLKRGGMAVDAQDSAGNHALGAACCGGHLDLVKQLVEAHGAPLELKNQIGTTPLWLAAGYGHEGVLDAAAKRHTGCVRRLVEAGARHMTVNSGGDSPLSLAVSDSNVAMAEILLAQPGGAILIKRKNNKGVHPMASAAAGGNAELVSLLLKAGGSVADTDSNGATPLALAAFCGATEVVQLLLATAGAALESVVRAQFL
jgi:ankyrin repeat protein